MDNPEALVETVIVRKIDDLGRIVIPAETRRLFNIREGDELEVSVENNAIVLRKLEATCVFCGSTDDVEEFLGRGICGVCRSKVAA
jgi:AbrB family transcriptional regulator, transcriptional pleiotropic regulator of transition state genes